MYLICQPLAVGNFRLDGNFVCFARCVVDFAGEK
jgi:hypothetical protein